VGIIALGRIAEMIRPFQGKQTLYYNTHRHEDKEVSLGLQFAEMDELLRKGDIVFLCTPNEVGDKFYNADHFAKMKNNALLVNFMRSNIIDVDAHYATIDSGKIRAVSDYPMDERFNKFPSSTFYSFKASNAFNTDSSMKFTSDKATQALSNLLTSGKDENKVN
jgi:lactate dehydrogenase-like 2-hydroxyacid dehydrogenase